MPQASTGKNHKPPKPPGRRLRVVRTLIIMAVLLSGAALVATGLFAYGKYRFEAAGPANAETVVLLPRGLSLSAIADKLEREQTVSNAFLFEVIVRLMRIADALKAGEYAIPARASMADIVKMLHDGKSILHKLTVPEGLTSFQVVQLIKAHPVLTGETPPVPEEGALLPETYLFERGTDRAELLVRMAAAKQTLLQELWPKRAKNLPLATPYQAQILASIVEKETGVPQERPRVAAVFINRLRKPMRLQSDPTVIYGVTGGKGPLGRPLRQSELDRPTPYNTYQIDGLPPTPIANPGRASLEAVLNPPATKDLYFVADGTGGHTFSATLDGHLKNVQKWRRFQHENGR